MQYHDYVTVYIVLFITAFITTATRTYVRKKINKTFHAEDWLAVMACITFFIQTVLNILFTRNYTIAIDLSMLIAAVHEDARKIPDFLKHMLEIQVGAHLGFLTTLWIIKFSFLFFYRRLAQGMPLSKLWVFTCVFTALSYIGNVIGFFFVCVPLSTYFDTTCSSQTSRSNASLYAGTVTDIVSDLLIMILPLRLLGHLRMSVLQKVGLSGLFCLGTAVIIMSIARTVRTTSGRNGALPESDPRWVAVWSSAEETTAILVCCLPAIRKLFTSHREHGGHVSTPWGWRPMSLVPRWSIRVPTRKIETEISTNTSHRNVQVEKDKLTDNFNASPPRRPKSVMIKTSQTSRSDAPTSSSSSQEELYHNMPHSPDSTTNYHYSRVETV